MLKKIKATHKISSHVNKQFYGYCLKSIPKRGNCVHCLK